MKTFIQVPSTDDTVEDIIQTFQTTSAWGIGIATGLMAFIAIVSLLAWIVWNKH